MATALLLALLNLGAERRAVVVTTDCGASYDDQWALLHMALSSEIELKGVITSHAPNLAAPASETSAREARHWLDRVNAHPPLFAGSRQPLEDRGKPGANPGVAFLIEQAKTHSARDRLLVVVIGPATDAASSLLIDPSLADRIAIVAMGFNDWPEGGDVWNVKNDVRAWQILLESRTPIVVGAARVTQRDLVMTADRARRLFGESGAVGLSLVRILDTWIATNPKLALSTTGQPGAGAIWDEVATAALLGLVKTETHPRPHLRDDLTFEHVPNQGTIDWVSAIDAEALWKDLARKLKGHRSAGNRP